jgi:hypothetical protein
VKKGSGGIVSARIEELNSRVSEIRKMKRMRKKMTNPRLHTHNFDNKQPVRNRALINYKTSFKTADIEKCNSYMAAKFNVIPDVDDEDSSLFSSERSPHHTNYFPSKFSNDTEGHDDDDVSKLSHGTSGTYETNKTHRSSESNETGGTGGTVATVVQQRNDDSIRSRTYSESTASSGFSNVRKQVFRVSDATKSVSSSGESTTLSAIIHKENEFFPPAALHLSPVQRTPMQAMKWRSLAMAAAEKDSRSNKNPAKKKGLAPRGNNQNSVPYGRPHLQI